MMEFLSIYRFPYFEWPVGHQVILDIDHCVPPDIDPTNAQERDEKP